MVDNNSDNSDIIISLSTFAKISQFDRQRVLPCRQYTMLKSKYLELAV